MRTLFLSRNFAPLLGLGLLCGGTGLAHADRVAVTIESTPQGASVQIDGREQRQSGQPPGPIKLRPGVHRIRLELPGYRPLQQTIEVGRRPQRLAFTLSRAGAAASQDMAAAARDNPGGDAGGGRAAASPERDLAASQAAAPTAESGLMTGPTRLAAMPSAMAATLPTAMAAAPTTPTPATPPPAPAASAPGGQPAVPMMQAPGAAMPAPPAPPALMTPLAAPMTATPPESSTELQQLRRQLDELRRTVEAIRGVRDGALDSPTLTGPIRANAAMPGTAMPGSVEGMPLFLGLRLNASVTLRYDWTQTADPTDQIQDGNLLWNSLRTRVRLGVTYDQGPVVAGLRLAVGETPNPAASFISLGDSGRPKSIGLDQFYATVRPLADRDRLSLTVGKMPNPLWRGDRGTVRDELIWDDDINPEGISLHATLYKSGGDKPAFKLENNLAYFVLNDLQSFRFSGLTGTSFMIAEQLHLTLPYVSAAISYYNSEHLNDGLLSPSYSPGAAFPGTGTAAALLRPGLQGTNNRVNVGPGAEGFLVDTFRVGSALLQAKLPLPRLVQLGKPEFFLLGNYTRNFSAERDQNAYGITVGLRAGAFGDGSVLHPLNVWFTWRDVDADATLSAYTDSDLGGGTAARGLEVGANYRIFKNLMAAVSYFNYQGFPFKDTQTQRLFVDLVADF